MAGKTPGQIGDTFALRGVARFGPFTLDPAMRQLSRAGATLHVTPKAFDLLTLLLAEAPRVVSKAEIHASLWPETFVSEATLVGLVKELRRALDDHDRTSPIIRTAHAVGYAIAIAVDRGPGPGSSGLWHWIDLKGRGIRLVDGENLIGRDPSSRIWLDVSSVSRQHARILVSGDGAVLEDLGSKNQTRVGDAVLSGRVRLRNGDRISVGPSVLVYRESRGGMSTDTQADT